MRPRQRPGPPTGPPRRILYYCHDTYGLGHLRRTLAIAERVARHAPGVAQLVVTGSPVAGQLLRERPGLDVVTLPAATKVGAEAYRARTLGVSFEALRDLRASILHGVARSFGPDVFVVDHAPAGLAGEVLPALRLLSARRPRPLCVLGLRDVIDEPEVVRRVWAAQGIHALLDRLYDRILVYGQRSVFDPVRQYGLSAGAAAKVRFVGYLGRDVAPRRAGRPCAGPAEVLVTAGGGGDGFALFAAALRAAERGDAGCLDAPPRWTMVLGPLMAEDERRQLHARAEGLPGLCIRDFDAALERRIAGSDAVVSMGGYNTVCEILSARAPALLVPRVAPRREQAIRAEALRRRRLVRTLTPDELSPARLWQAVEALLTEPPAASRPVDLGGLDATCESLLSPLRVPAQRQTAGALLP